jgi:hypothetical protein
MAMWLLLKDREDVRNLYTGDTPDTADELPFSVRQSLGNFLFEIDFKTYDKPEGFKELFNMVSKIIGKNAERKAIWTDWLKLPVTECKGKKHTHPTLFKLLQKLADSEAVILEKVQADQMADEEDSEDVAQPEPAPVVEVKQEPTEVEESEAKPTIQDTVAEIAKPAPVTVHRTEEITLALLAQVTENVLKRNKTNHSSLKIYQTGADARIALAELSGGKWQSTPGDIVTQMLALRRSFKK